MVLPRDDVGAGPAVLLLHAGVADRTMWAEHLQPIADAGHRVVAVDLPGFGEAPASFELGEWLHVVETLDALGIERAAMVGNSFGADVALRVALIAPERVAALVLVAARPPGMEPSGELEAVWAAEGAALERGDVDAAVEAIVAAWVTADEVRERVAAMQRHAFEVQLAAGEPASWPPDPLEADPAALERLEIPALVATGELDMPDFRRGAATLAERLPRAREAVIAGAGHLAPLEQPDAFRALLLRFLQAAR